MVATVRTPDSREHYVVLDGFRGMAALFVVFLHASEVLHVPIAPAYAALAVDFFFGLSGFVIAHAYDAALRSGRLSPAGFLKRRLIRLYPLILLGVSLGALSLLSSATHGAPQPLWRVAALVVGSATLIPVGQFFGLATFVVNSPVWSLSFEALANAAYVPLARMSAWVIAALAAAGAAVLIPLAWVHGGAEGLGFEGADWLAGGLGRVVTSFALGLLIHRLRIHERAPSLPGSVLGAALAAVLLLGLGSPRWLSDCAAILLVFPAIVALGARASVSRWSAPVWRVLGELSFPLYALHEPLLQFADKVDNHLLHATPLAGAVFAISLSLALSWAAYRLYDVPVRRWLARRPSTHPARQAPAA